MTEERAEYINDCQIYSYRMSDGAHIVAQELDSDDDNNVIVSSTPLKIKKHKSTYSLVDYIIPLKGETSYTEINISNIVTRTEASFDLKDAYLKYLLIAQLEQCLHPSELGDILNDYQDHSQTSGDKYQNRFKLN
jgi:AAA15 family ATPase/GTPase